MEERSLLHHQSDLNRREFLNLTWLASLGFLVVNFGGVTLLFSMPRFREGEFGGRFVLGPAKEVLPDPGGDPIPDSIGKYWLARLETGLIVALYKVCTHLGCIYNWRRSQQKFICPCHGSQFQLDGTYIQGPAPRSADRFLIRLLDEQGTEISTTDTLGNPLSVPDTNLRIVVDTGQLIRGQEQNIPYPIS
ncbi:MAG: hypothetical protein DWQ07_18435 [Chloroflexi bacterium]|nr:MAG: hypothetical protein DWQ07_18435 [Chloroflexota bacterium]